MSQFGWDKPSLERVRNAVIDSGKKAHGIRGNSFQCQCPANDGTGFNVQFKHQPDGKISFRCFSRDCDFQSMIDCLDLVHADFYPESMNPLRPKRAPYEPTLDETIIFIAECDIAAGKAISETDYERYKKALMNVELRMAS